MFTVILQSSDFDFLLTKGVSKHTHKNDPRCSLLLRFDPLVDRDVAVGRHIAATSVVPSKPLQQSSAEPLLSLHVSAENENLNETLPLPELDQQSAPNSSTEDITPVNIVVNRSPHTDSSHHSTSITNGPPTAIVNSVSSGLHSTADTTFIHPVVSY